ncbi:MAG: class I SAM-dependent methyltransferase [Saprospiraceae bacterium]
MIPTTFLQEELRRYCEENSDVSGAYLAVIERITNLETLAPQMLSGVLQGRLLSTLSKLHKPKCILEIGTFTGYSALCLAEGLIENGILHTIEVDDKYDKIIDFIKSEVPLAKKIVFHKADAIPYIPTLDLSIDLAFIDASKKDYLKYLKIIEPYMNKGSLLISDNVLYYGKVIDKIKDQDTTILNQYNKYLKVSPNWDTMILPFRDGISIAQKLY